jgi:AraC-type DNA-binding domain-containing proteins
MATHSLVTSRSENLLAGILADNAIRRSAGNAVADTTGRTTYPNATARLDLKPAGSDRGEVSRLFELPLVQVAEAMSDDPIAQRLFKELGRVEDSNDDAYEATLRLALAARLLSAQSAEAETRADALQKWRLKRVTAYIDERISEALSLSELARVAGLSRMYFAARFRAATGLRPHEYVLRRRIERAKELLAQTEDALAIIAMDVGFQTQAHFTTVFKKLVGITPGRWRSLNQMISLEGAR